MPPGQGLSRIKYNNNSNFRDKPRLGVIQIPTMGWPGWFGLAPTLMLEFWVRLQNERNQGKQASSVKVAPGSSTGHTSTILLALREELCHRSCSNKHQKVF